MWTKSFRKLASGATRGATESPPEVRIILGIFFASPKELPVSRTRKGFNKARECTEGQERRDCLRNACAVGRIL